MKLKAYALSKKSNGSEGQGGGGGVLAEALGNVAVRDTPPSSNDPMPPMADGGARVTPPRKARADGSGTAKGSNSSKADVPTPLKAESELETLTYWGARYESVH